MDGGVCVGFTSSDIGARSADGVVSTLMFGDLDQVKTWLASVTSIASLNFTRTMTLAW